MADDGDTVPWRELLAETADRFVRAGLEAAGSEARWLIEEITGLDGAALHLGLDEPATQRGVARLDEMIARRLDGEPIQYVLGHWPFRSLDLLCDRRVLIPRPETEQVVDHALAELDRVTDTRRSRSDASTEPGAAGLRADTDDSGDDAPVVVDLGAGSGAIALSIASERPGTDVWGVDASADALAVARANLGGLGMAGARVRLVEGSWYEPLPDELAGRIALVVANPPYIGDDEDLDASVRDWEPEMALVSGATGFEDLDEIIRGAVRWLAADGALVLEVGAGQADAVATRCSATVGLVDVRIEPDHAGHGRCVVARRS